MLIYETDHHAIPPILIYEGEISAFYLGASLRESSHATKERLAHHPPIVLRVYPPEELVIL